ncbi:oligosaccharide flippase family protein [Paraburkholderia humisilvae]|uniref:Uncharacterized protein n=1 Tax=Paraburkholderia humisilvae TaxID=627669 RepID=A0A6J5F2K6_9BURK|nr:lipopolysaccharide biosynthesis protein [Paraburkholderia humisilvae]CAB3773038.1 hypothetical protein LMG29542_07089 [Paraburkholderia humisilvae]
MIAAYRLPKMWNTYLPYALGITGNAAFNIALISLLTHQLVPAVYGDYTVFVTVIVLASAVVGQWLQQATGRYLAGCTAPASDYTKAAVLLGLGGVLLALSAICLFAALLDLLHRTTDSELWLAAVVSVAAQVPFTLVGTMLQSEQRAWSYALLQTCSGSLKIGLSLLVCRVAQQDVGGILYACAAAQCVGVAFGASRAGLFSKAISQKLKSRRTRVLLCKLRAYGGAMTVWFIFMNLAMYCDRLLVRAFAGSASAGLYGAASTLVVGSVSLVMAPILAVTWPNLMAAWNGRNEQAASRLLGNMLTVLLCAGVTLVAIVNAVAVPATRLFLGEKFAAAAPLLPLLTASAFSFSLGTLFHKPLEFKEKKVTMCVFAAAVLLLNGLLSSVFTPRLGAIGAGVAALLSGSSYCALCAWRGRQIVRWRIQLDLLAVVTGLAAGASIAVNLLSTSWHLEGNLLMLVAVTSAFGAMFGPGLAVAVLLHANHRAQTQTIK